MINNPLQNNTHGLGRRTSQAPEARGFFKDLHVRPHSEFDRSTARIYNRFLQMDLIPEERDTVGLQSVFASIFPVSDFPRNGDARIRRISNRQLAVQVRKS
jgi:DNA-directed RNA polymerase subunit beta